MTNHEKALRRHAAIISRVLALAAANDADMEPIRLGTITQEVGVSPRTLHYIWTKHFGSSPRCYFLLRRMEQARAALIKGDAVTVTGAAMDHGFYQLGRFAAQYRRRYGEMPSATLRAQTLTNW